MCHALDLHSANGAECSGQVLVIDVIPQHAVGVHDAETVAFAGTYAQTPQKQVYAMGKLERRFDSDVVAKNEVGTIHQSQDPFFITVFYCSKCGTPCL